MNRRSIIHNPRLDPHDPFTLFQRYVSDLVSFLIIASVQDPLRNPIVAHHTVNTTAVVLDMFRVNVDSPANRVFGESLNLHWFLLGVLG